MVNIGNLNELEKTITSAFNNGAKMLKAIPLTLIISGEISAKIDVNGASALATALANQVVPQIINFIQSKLPQTGTISGIDGSTQASPPGMPLGSTPNIGNALPGGYNGYI
jgi:hypothetical protein